MQFVPLLDTPPAVQQALRLLRNQPAVRQHMYSDHEIGEAEHARWLASLQGNPRQQVFAVMVEEELGGLVSLNAIDPQHGRADWAFYIDSQLQGKGLGSLIEFMLLDHAFGAAGLHKLNCEVLASNTAVVRMHQKFGFQLEGVRRQDIVKAGARVDVVLLGMTRDEWQAQRPKMAALIERLGRAGPQGQQALR